MKLLHGDCLELMKEIPDGSIDMILCDLPFGTTALSWDSIISIKPLWEQYRRIIKPNHVIVLHATQPFASMLVYSNLPWFKYDWIWIKSRPTGFAQAKNQPLREHENIVVFSEGAAIHANQTTKKMPYYPQGLQPTNYVKKQSKSTGKTDTCFSNRISHKSEHQQEQTNYPRSILPFPSESKTVHPTQKPVSLCEYLIRTYTNEGDTVLDNCMGSGSTGIACLNTNRDFIGMEKDETYFNIAVNRIATHKDTFML